MNVNSYYSRPWILNRYFVGPIASHLSLFADFLVKKGYSNATGQRYVREVGHLSRWLDRQGVGIAELNEVTISTYLCFRYQSKRLQVKKMALPAFAQLLAASWDCRNTETCGNASRPMHRQVSRAHGKKSRFGKRSYPCAHSGCSKFPLTSIRGEQS